MSSIEVITPSHRGARSRVHGSPSELVVQPNQSVQPAPGVHSEAKSFLSHPHHIIPRLEIIKSKHHVRWSSLNENLDNKLFYHKMQNSCEHLKVSKTIVSEQD